MELAAPSPLHLSNLITDAVIGQIDTVLEMVQPFQSTIAGETKFPQELYKLNVTQSGSLFPVRIKCANLAWHTLKAALEVNSNCLSNE